METEIWKDILGYEGLYKVSNLGNVKSLLNGKWNYKREKILKFGMINGYHKVNLFKNKIRKDGRVHRLVAQAFLGLDINNPKIFVCHKNDIRNDNRLENLFLGTCKDNVQDCIDKGRFKYSNHRKYGDEYLIKLKSLHNKGFSTRKIGKIIGMSKSNVHYLIKNLTMK